LIIHAIRKVKIVLEGTRFWKWNKEKDYSEKYLGIDIYTGSWKRWTFRLVKLDR